MKKIVLSFLFSMMIAASVMAEGADGDWTLLVDGKNFAIYYDAAYTRDNSQDVTDVRMREKWVIKNDIIKKVQDIFSFLNVPAYGIRTSSMNMVTHQSSIEAIEVYGTKEKIGEINSEMLLKIRDIIPDSVSEDVRNALMEALLPWFTGGAVSL